MDSGIIKIMTPKQIVIYKINIVKTLTLNMEPISILIGLVVIIALILYVIAIWDLIRNRQQFKPRSNQSLWLILVVFIPIIGSIIYLSLKCANRKSSIVPDDPAKY